MTPALQREIAEISLSLVRLNASWERLRTRVYEDWKAQDEGRPARGDINISVTVP